MEDVITGNGGVSYELLSPTRGRANYKVLAKPEGMSDEEVAVAVDSRAGIFGFQWNGDTLSVYTD